MKNNIKINDLLQRIENLEKAVFGKNIPSSSIKSSKKEECLTKLLGELNEKFKLIKSHYELNDTVIFQAILNNNNSDNYQITSLFTLNDEENVADIVAICNVLSSTQRISILKHLYRTELSSGELVEITKMAGGHLHHHLKELQSKSFVEKNEHGKYRATKYGLHAYLTIAILNRSIRFNN